MRKEVNNPINEIEPIIFQNKPIEEEDKDIFGNKYQTKVLNKAIDKNSRIIGIVGDYGTGKSSITKLLEKERKNKKDKIININLWGQISKNDGTPEQQNDSLIKSFLYQLAFANKKQNGNFAKYINARFNKNNGKIGFAISTRKIFFILFFAVLLFLFFITLNTIELKLPAINEQEILKDSDLINKIFSFLSYLRYGFLGVSIGLTVWAISISSPVFSSWKSEGNYIPDNSDIYEIYLRIINRIKPKLKKRKCIIFVDDLDRSSDKELVVSFLKEIYKCVHLLPTELQSGIVFVISLKAETLLDLDDNENPDTTNIYSKIFDYTLNIKQIHRENYRDVVYELLWQERTQICALKKKISSKNETEEIIIGKVLSELKWIYSDENVTIREIKERLNETFILYQTLLDRNYTNPSITLNKCAAAIFLKRKFEHDYMNILSHEKDFADLIRLCNKKEIDINEEIENCSIFTDIDKDLKESIKEMISKQVIEDDFSMYFYSYPKGSYIKNATEKEVFDAVVHDNPVFLWDEKNIEKVSDVITKYNGKVIKEAFEKYLQDNVPDIIYDNEQLFKFVIINFKQHHEYIINAIENEISLFISDTSRSPLKTINCFKYDFSKSVKDKIIQNTNSKIIEYLETSDPSIIEKFRIDIYQNFSEVIEFLLPIYTTIDLPLITKKTYQGFSEKFQATIIFALQEIQLAEFDKYGVEIKDFQIEKYLYENHNIISLLYTYEKNDRINDFDFSKEWICEKIIEVSPFLLKLDKSLFVKIRSVARQKMTNYTEAFSSIYNDSYPLITDNEIHDINVSELQDYVDFQKITINNCTILSLFCNEKKLRKDELYLFIETVCLNRDIIDDDEIIKEIFTSIDFNIVDFNSLTSDQKSLIISGLYDIFDLGSAAGAIQFMYLTKCLLEKLEEEFENQIITDKTLHTEYLKLLNNLKTTTEISLEIVRSIPVTIGLVPEITDKLLHEQIYLRYIIGKTLFDKEVIYNKNVPLEKYYKVFITNSLCLEYFKLNAEIIKLFYQQKLYINNETPSDRYEVFYKFRQPIDLIKQILHAFKNDNDKQKSYLYQITDINTEEDAMSFISVITHSDYINLLTDSELFYYLWHKMWNRNQKSKLTKTVNQLLGTSYNAGDAN